MNVAKEREEMKMMMMKAMGDGKGGEKRGNEGGTRTVVVGIKMDGQGRELLSWVLVTVARPGDSVVVLHVLPEMLPSFEHGNPPASMSLLYEFDSVLAMYEGFCKLKQIDLKLRLCRDSSVRKALVREVRSISASKFILGACSKNHGVWFHSIAQYCAGKVGDHCMVLAVNKGTIVFQREARRDEQLNVNGRNSQVTSTKNSVLLNGSNDNKLCVVPAEKFGSIILRTTKFCNGKNSMLLGVSDGDFLLLLPTKKYGRKGSSYGEGTKNCSIPSVATNCGSHTQSKEESSLATVPGRSFENSQESISLLIQSLPDARLGWPLLRKAVLHKKKVSYKKPQMPFSHSTMTRPSWYPASLAETVLSNQSPKRMEIKATYNLDSEEKEVVVPAGVDELLSSDASSNEESPKLPKELEDLHEKYSSTCRLFTFKELADATSNFSLDNFIGKGGSSRVYRGILPDGREIAVKILKQTEDAPKELALEIEIMSTLHHKNIISLNGFCFDSDKLHLVYNFMPRKSLEKNLHGENKGNNSIGWAERYKVAVGVARALDYLHGREGVQHVIHRDVKSSNILLSDDYEAQLSDFGLAAWASSTSELIFDDVAGTFGYLAPEYFMFGKVTEKIDVYAFGVVLLELLSGKKPIGNEHPKGQESLVMWTKTILRSGNFTRLLDPSLGSKYDDQMERMVLAASLCVKRSPRLRPNMATVLRILQGDDAELINWARLQVDASEEREGSEDETVECSPTDFQSHLTLALLDVEDETHSVGGVDHAADYIRAHSSLEEYLQGRWSRSSSFN